MKIMLVAGMLITMPAIAVTFYFFGQRMMVPAIASLTINLLPFIVGGLLLRKSRAGASDLSH